MKRIVAMLLSVILLVTLLAACGSDQKNDVSTPSDTSSNAASGGDDGDSSSEPAGDEEAYNVIMTVTTIGVTPPDLQLVQEEINKIALAETNTTVELLPIAITELSQKYSLMLSSGEKLDLAMSFVGLTPVSSFVSKGQIIELDDLVAQRGQDILEAEQIAMAGGYYNGKLYGVPSEEKYGRPQGMYLRADLVQKYNIDVDSIKTYEDITAMFATIKENEPDIIPLSTVGSNATTFGSVFNPLDLLGSTIASGGLLNAGQGDTTVLNVFATPAYEEHVTWMRRWYEAGYFLPDAITTSDSSVDLGKAGRAFAGLGSVEPGQVSNLSRDWGYEMVGLELVPAYATTNTYQTTMWCIPITCENPERTMDFLNLTYKDETVVNLLSNGIEGVHYVKTDDPMIITYPEGMDLSNTGYNMPLHTYGDKMKKYAWVPTDPAVFDQLKALNAEVAANGVSKTLGYVFNADSVKSEFTAVTNVIAEYRAALETGSVDPTTALPEFISKLESAGIDKIIEENQRQLDAWLEANG